MLFTLHWLLIYFYLLAQNQLEINILSPISTIVSGVLHCKIGKPKCAGSQFDMAF